MNKKVALYSFLLLALFVSAFSYSATLQSPFITALNAFKNSYFVATHNLERTIQAHFFQAKEIENLQQRLERYKSLELQMQSCQNRLIDLMKENNATLGLNPDIELIHAISYQKFGNFNRLWMAIPDYNGSKIYGLIQNNSVAGIVINEHNKPLALLNSDIKSTYSVYVGKAHAPGIAHGNSDKNIIVSFIPTWFLLHIGDEVITSGLDNIFFKGIKVGKVTAIKLSQGYQKVTLSPYFQANEPDYFYMIKRLP